MAPVPDLASASAAVHVTLPKPVTSAYELPESMAPANETFPEVPVPLVVSMFNPPWLAMMSCPSSATLPPAVVRLTAPLPPTYTSPPTRVLATPLIVIVAPVPKEIEPPPVLMLLLRMTTPTPSCTPLSLSAHRLTLSLPGPPVLLIGLLTTTESAACRVSVTSVGLPAMVIGLFTVMSPMLPPEVPVVIVTLLPPCSAAPIEEAVMVEEDVGT